MSFSDFRPAPNQGGRPDLYELENRAMDPDGLVLEEMRQLAPWAGRLGSAPDESPRSSS
jgi:hypothetical protein